MPVAGDFDGDGIDTVETFNDGTWTIRNFNELNNAYPGPATIILFGLAGDLPVAGDWDGDGKDSVGVFRPSAAQFFLTNSLQAPNIDVTAFFGIAEDIAVAGDFDGDGIDSIGVWRPSSQTYFLTNDNINISNQFLFGALRTHPVIGDWDGKPNQ